MTLLVALVLAVQAPADASLPEILIERRLAETASLSVGDTLSARAQGATVAPTPFVVAGIYERAADPHRISRNEPEVRLHLADLEALLPGHDRVDRFAVTLAPGASPDAASRWIESLAYGTAVYPADALADESSATFQVISRFHRAIGVVTILASSIFLLCVMIIRVDERRPDMGLLRLVGISRRTVFRAVVLETVAVAVIGSLLGALLGIGITRIVNAYYADFYDTTLRFAVVTPGIVGFAALLGLLLGAAAGVLAALRVVRTPPQKLGER